MDIVTSSLFTDAERYLTEQTETAASISLAAVGFLPANFFKKFAVKY